KMRAEDIAKLDRPLSRPRQAIVDAPEQEWQPFAEVTEDELGRMLLEQAGEDEAHAERRGLDREAPGGAQQDRKVLGVFLVIGVDHRLVRHRGVQIDRHVERRRAREDWPEALIVEEVTVRDAVDHRALEAERLDAARKLVGRGRRIAGRQHRKTRVAFRLRGYDL